MKRLGRKGFSLGALLAVVGPGLLAGLSDDDPAGITTYSVLGADHGYRLLWVLLLSTIALVLFHGLAASGLLLECLIETNKFIGDKIADFQ